MSIPIGPILDVTLRTIDCGCVVDDAGGIWSPCRAIAEIHAAAMATVRAGVTDADMRTTRGRGGKGIWGGMEGWIGGQSPPLTLRDRLDDMARHVRRGGE